MFLRQEHQRDVQISAEKQTQHHQRAGSSHINDTQLLASEAEAESVPKAPDGAGGPSGTVDPAGDPKAPLMVGIPIKVFLVLQEFYSLFTMSHSFTKVSSTMIQNHFIHEIFKL